MLSKQKECRVWRLPNLWGGLQPAESAAGFSSDPLRGQIQPCRFRGFVKIGLGAQNDPPTRQHIDLGETL
jgi:hypothetical protein